MKKVLISSFDMEVGGVERSLISMLSNFDYTSYDVNLMLYSHTGEFMDQIPGKSNLLHESPVYKTFRLSIKDVLKSGRLPLGAVRLYAKYKANKGVSLENGYKQMQYMWKYSLPFLPAHKGKYDAAISYLWPHYFVAEKVEADVKIAWIHTDYSTVETDIETDLEMWNKFHYIIAVSDQCRKAFIQKYPTLQEKVIVIENITSPDLVRTLAEENTENEISQDKRFALVTVARLSHAKGIDNAVKALKLLHDRGYSNLAWYIVGYGGDEDKIRNLIRETNLQNSFILLGKKINPYPYVKAADVYVQPSRYEGKAVTVGEAQILARPVVITNYKTSASQVNNMTDGYICDLSIEGIADGIEALYNNENTRNTLAGNCARKDFSNSRELEKLYDLVGRNNVETKSERYCSYL
ncbi:glycosyltransferase [Evansella sp. LMS18]|uniref:glycosyltransferase n=1 Tax=Evansella sp. LMS18 TaxID=2924033 RepID=UPI0020D0D162|nr:glycosyltransferase [Evansella sp. LMS18]UTR10578.1 glycosyltransferase [Evansella sp. LMS18]